jgi:TM2 domain-containing membrane protein YozV
MSDICDTHVKTIGYALWVIGFMGAHRFYQGKIGAGILCLLTLGLAGFRHCL